MNKSLEHTHPHLAKEWHPTKNGLVKPSEFTYGSGVKVWWKCNRGHEWLARIDHRAKGIGCPYCSKKACWPGENDLVSCFPHLASEWNYEKNDCMPQHVAAHSNKSYWWKCDKGHEWKAVVNNRVKGNGCPYCSNRKLLVGFNDLKTLFPQLALEWNYQKNASLLPSQVMSKSNRKVWWRCNLGHEWLAAINNRARGDKCPICTNRVVLNGFNDLATTHPELASEWSYKKNGTRKPCDFVAGSAKIIWWKCNQCGNEWKASISNRTRGGGCPKCHDRNRTSFPEQALFFYIKKCFMDAQNRYREALDKKHELDIYIPSKNIAIEYDGAFWHKTDGRKEIHKYNLCIMNNIYLVRIKEKHSVWDEESCDLAIYSETSLEETIKKVGLVLDVELAPNLERDRYEILAGFYNSVRDKSLAAKHPAIAKEWNYPKNHNLAPEMFYEYSNEKVWWICDKNHEWETSISNRSNLGRGCPYCTGQKAIIGVNDVFTKYPSLRKEWNVEKNGPLDLNLTAGSNKKVWWKCSICGNEWKTSISKRSAGTSCPKCSSRKRALQKQKAAKEFESEAQHASPHITLLEEYSNVSTKLLVKCNKCEYQWKTSPTSILKSRGCPACSNRIVIPGRNDLMSQFPMIAKEWDYCENEGITPDRVVYGSSRSIHWRCHICDFRWKDTVEHRTSGRGCPNCAKKKNIY